MYLPLGLHLKLWKVKENQLVFINITERSASYQYSNSNDWRYAGMLAVGLPKQISTEGQITMTVYHSFSTNLVNG